MDNQERRIREALAISRVVSIEGVSPMNDKPGYVMDIMESGING